MTIDVLYVAWNRRAFTEFSFRMLIENTDWSIVDRLVVHDDGSEDGTDEWLGARVDEIRRGELPGPAEVDFRIDALRSPPAVMNRYVAAAEAEWFAKIDNDIVVCPGWLPAMLGVLERNPEVELLGMEAGRGNRPAEGWDGVYGFEPGSHMGGVGLIRVEALARRAQLSERTGRFGFTEFQHEYRPVRGWVSPDLPVVALDRVPLEPWSTLSDLYQRIGWQREGWRYHERSDYWDCWPADLAEAAALADVEWLEAEAKRVEASP